MHQSCLLTEISPNFRPHVAQRKMRRYIDRAATNITRTTIETNLCNGLRKHSALSHYSPCVRYK